MAKQLAETTVALEVSQCLNSKITSEVECRVGALETAFGGITIPRDIDGFLFAHQQRLDLLEEQLHAVQAQASIQNQVMIESAVPPHVEPVEHTDGQAQTELAQWYAASNTIFWPGGVVETCRAVHREGGEGGERNNDGADMQQCMQYNGAWADASDEVAVHVMLDGATSSGGCVGLPPNAAEVPMPSLAFKSTSVHETRGSDKMDHDRHRVAYRSAVAGIPRKQLLVKTLLFG